MKPAERTNSKILRSLYRGLHKSGIAHLSIFALLISQLPSPAGAQSQAKPTPEKYRDLSCELPGISCGNHLGLIIGGSAAGAGVVALLVYQKNHGKGSTAVKLDTKAVNFGDFTPGQPVKLSVSLKDMMSAPITVKEVAVEDPSGALTLGDARVGTFTLAPGEAYDLPVMLNTSNTQGKARVRVVATSPKAKKDVVQFINVSYGKAAPKQHHKLLPSLHKQ